MAKNKWSSVFFAIFSGLLFWLAWPSKPFSFLIFIAFVPLLFIEDRLYENKVKRPLVSLFLYCMLAFAIWNSLTTYWIYNASLPGAISAILINSILMSLPFLLFHKIKLWSGRKLSYLYLVALWMAYEYLHINWQFAWPWLHLGNVFALYPQWVQWYEYTGIPGGTLWVWMANLLAFSIIRRLAIFNDETISNFKLYLRSIELVVVLAVPVIISYSTDVTPGKDTGKNVVIVQPNIDPYTDKFQGDFSDQLDLLISLSEESIDSNTAFVLWPETAISRPQDENSLQYNGSIFRIRDMLRRHPGLKLISGLDSYRFLREDETVTPTARYYEQADLYYDRYNAAFMMDENMHFKIYHKAKLVPGVEKMPYPRLFKFLGKLVIDLGGTSGSLGRDKEAKVFDLNDSVKLAPVICYESVFGDYCGDYVMKGANVLTIVTNDGWWKNTDGHRQHFDYAALRAIELRKPVYRSANTGLSGVFNEKGKTLVKTKWWEPRSFKYKLTVNDTVTFYARNGDYLYRISVFVSIIIILVSLVKVLMKDNKYETTG